MENVKSSGPNSTLCLGFSNEIILQPFFTNSNDETDTDLYSWLFLSECAQAIFHLTIDLLPTLYPLLFSMRGDLYELYSFFFFSLSPCHKACGILVPQPGIEPQPPTVKFLSSPLECQGSFSMNCILLSS